VSLCFAEMDELLNIDNNIGIEKLLQEKTILELREVEIGQGKGLDTVTACRNATSLFPLAGDTFFSAFNLLARYSVAWMRPCTNLPRGPSIRMTCPRFDKLRQFGDILCYQCPEG
jgi:hypothetical protein